MKAFTLIELMIVVMIIIILVAMAVPMWQKHKAGNNLNTEQTLSAKPKECIEMNRKIYCEKP